MNALYKGKQTKAEKMNVENWDIFESVATWFRWPYASMPYTPLAEFKSPRVAMQFSAEGEVCEGGGHQKQHSISTPTALTKSSTEEHYKPVRKEKGGKIER
jgi:hypothetical protein